MIGGIHGIMGEKDLKETRINAGKGTGEAGREMRGVQLLERSLKGGKGESLSQSTRKEVHYLTAGKKDILGEGRDEPGFRATRGERNGRQRKA